MGRRKLEGRARAALGLLCSLGSKLREPFLHVVGREPEGGVEQLLRLERQLGFRMTLPLGDASGGHSEMSAPILAAALRRLLPVRAEVRVVGYGRSRPGGCGGARAAYRGAPTRRAGTAGHHLGQARTPYGAVSVHDPVR